MPRTLSHSERHVLETASSDQDLCARLTKSEWLRGAEYQLPPWLKEVTAAPVLGMPSVIPYERKAEFDNTNLEPATSNEVRLVRNKVAIKQLMGEITQKSGTEAKQQDALQAAHLRATVLAPFYQRLEEDHNTIVQLRQKLSDAHAGPERTQSIEKSRGNISLSAIVETHAIAPFTSEELSLQSINVEVPVLLTNTANEQAPSADIATQQASIDNHNLRTRPATQALIADVTPIPYSRTPKRKATAPPSNYGQEVRHLKAGSIFDQKLAGLAIRIFEEVRKPLPSDPIEACGTGPLSILLQRPRDALALAHKELHTTTPGDVDPCWRRLYEDATLHVVAQLLHKQAMQAQPAPNRAKRVKLSDGVDSGSWLQEIVGKLDLAVIVAGAPGRRDLVDSIFDQLDPIAQRTLSDQDPQPLVRGAPLRPLNTKHAITRPKVVMSQSAFAQYVVRDGNAVRPLILQGVMEEWPAIELWQDLLYLKRHTMAGHRLVPVEIGKSYTDPGWGQEIITFSEFAERFLVPDNPHQTGYLAQYDIFHQIPTLRSDILIPDFCYSAPPPPKGAAARTKGLDTVQELEEPLLNAWLGPKGTKSPLHTDPYHNILCQVVGYKYVRLYAPEETDKLYPMGADDAGIEMDNTSEVDISVIRPRAHVSNELEAMRADTRKKFPLLESADFEEAMLGPGESLYIPLGWWHYVESLSTSISVSFWWN